MITDRISVIDVDSHVMEPADLWTSRLSEHRWGDDVPHVRREEKSGEDRWYVGGKRTSGVANFAVTGWNEFPPSHPLVTEDADPAAWDPVERLHKLDSYGIYSQLLYPNLLGFSSTIFLELDVELRNECVRAYNDFLIDFCEADPKRLIPLMWLPFWDVELSVREIERCAARGHKGIVFPSNFAPVNLPLLQEEHWYPIWESAQHHELSINFHTGFQVSVEEARSTIGFRATRADQTKGSALFLLGNARTIADITIYGICHRFPRLNFVSVESGFGWMPYFAEMLDWQWLNSGARDAFPEVDMMPSEYMQRQVYGTFWFEHKTVNKLVDEFQDTLMFESDFPHPTALTPGPASYSDDPKTMIEKNLSNLSEEILQKLLHNNAARVYHLS
jgi:uncharacterized protein